MTCVVLLDKKAPSCSDVQNWLSRNGLVTQLANDVSHAIEALSDFTVRNKPDVVLLEVAFMAESVDAVRSTLGLSSPADKITVFGLTGGEYLRGKSRVEKVLNTFTSFSISKGQVSPV